jgi:hypothetical protein
MWEDKVIIILVGEEEDLRTITPNKELFYVTANFKEVQQTNTVTLDFICQFLEVQVS